MADDVTTSGDANGRARLAAILDQYGLAELTDSAWDYYQNNTPSNDEFMYWLRQQPAYKNRFKAMDQLSKEGRAIDEGTYISLERGYRQRLRAAGVPEGFYDSVDDFTGFILADLSPEELGGRLDAWTSYVYKQPPAVRDELSRLYGLDSGGILALALDPGKALPLIEKQYLAAGAAAGAKAAGWGATTVAEAERLAEWGVDYGKAVSGFGQLEESKQLFDPLVGDQGEDTISRDEQQQAVFGGNANAARRIRQRQRKRQAQFAERYDVAGSGGFGTAST